MAIQTLASQTGAKPARIRRVQNVTLVLLFIAGIVNFLDRSSLSVAGEAIRGDLGLSATEFGVLLSAFSLSYGFAQLPSGMLLDRFGPRIVLGAGLIFWSLMQALTGMVNSFSHFILLRIGLGIGEAPFMPAGVKSINDWYVQKERGTAVGIFNSSTVLGQAIAPPALVLMQIAWGWRTMFVVIGLAGIVVGLCWYAWYRNRAQFDLQQDERLYLAAPVQARPTLNFSEWLGLFKRRTTWGMILGFSGVNYTGWLYIAWLPGYLQAQQGLSLAKTGWVAAIPFLAAAVGMWVNGIVVDALARRGYDLAKTRKTAIVVGLLLSALGTLLVVQSSSPAQAVAFISMALFCVHFAGTSAWGLVQVLVSEQKVASVAAIQNFGSFVFASFAPVVTGWVVDTTHSFNLALVIAACVTFTGALCYFFIVKDPIH
ncbi:MFS transporter [Raoultella ornithinolytica]|jgi:sugar phosphate permease|uniref:MFS transporter n=1 Tax=Raoultella ornithinolytica TaxID=54291 RepID=A0A9Q9N0L4_RAOOR|nr:MULTISPECIES: MFS transporter [Raoultella]HDX8331760.1 MFS transporter [Raoultella ornithinolytica CD1_MRS_4]AGJ85813.1 major facilitator family transporter [Raoultella ornithinolytica B6]ANZ06215.1 L-galactonate transporter [Raoultella ornithinolytica]AOO55848.1 L-galactonate transporter [Raoultella ornithinolytica]APB06113.1 MFS transporter [Raoultella ornithinolytica]